MLQILRFLLAVSIAAVFAAVVIYIRQQESRPIPKPVPSPATTTVLPAADKAPVKRHPWSFTSNTECKSCHQAIWEEMVGPVEGNYDAESMPRLQPRDQHPFAWFNAFFTQDPKKTECSSCHASEPILEVGLDKEARVRADRFHEGIGCIECHRRGDGVEGPLPTTEAACNPVQNPAFRTNAVCFPCHAAHGSMDELAASEWGRRGTTCQECHMPIVLRPSANGGPVRQVRSHRMLSQRDPEFLQKAVTTTAAVEGRKVVVTIHNDNTGHNFPGEIFNREVFLKVILLDARGKEVPVMNRQGQEALYYRESIKTVNRQQRTTEPSTQIRPGEKRRYEFEIPPSVNEGRAMVVLGYKYMFLGTPDSANPFASDPAEKYKPLTPIFETVLSFDLR